MPRFPILALAVALGACRSTVEITFERPVGAVLAIDGRERGPLPRVERLAEERVYEVDLQLGERELSGRLAIAFDPLDGLCFDLPADIAEPGIARGAAVCVWSNGLLERPDLLFLSGRAADEDSLEELSDRHRQLPGPGTYVLNSVVLGVFFAGDFLVAGDGNVPDPVAWETDGAALCSFEAGGRLANAPGGTALAFVRCGEPPRWLGPFARPLPGLELGETFDFRLPSLAPERTGVATGSSGSNGALAASLYVDLEDRGSRAAVDLTLEAVSSRAIERMALFCVLPPGTEFEAPGATAHHAENDAVLIAWITDSPSDGRVAVRLVYGPTK